ncbi:hypothetical protein AVEN_165326-1 [Araneus ventricosus]|uniref:Uncharacterized protein n=1 Tax=Araneus ventricosus TaxID=182803 RepID=A0A4Y2AUB2_ARAVE|nr:hypothetical protein AVEN_165326-1 [Araneus ventricosus]
MNFNFLPTLKYMAAARIASRLTLNPEIVRMTEEEEKLPVFKQIFDCLRQEQWEAIEKQAEELLTPYFPTKLRKLVVKFIRPMNSEYNEWLSDHYFDDKVDENILKSCLSWKTDGTINRIETAQELVRNENIDLQSRFIMACTYFLEDEILVLWHKIKATKKAITRKGTNSAVRFWKKILNEGIANSWKQHVDVFFGESFIMSCDSQIRLSCFFDFLSPNNQKLYFSYYEEDKIQFNDFYLCLYKMDERERTEVLAENHLEALYHCSKWPKQSLFLEMAKHFYNKLEIHHFENILRSILDNCILKGLDYFDFQKLLEEFWHLTPAAYKEELEKNGQLMKQIKIVLNHNKTDGSLFLGETLNKYMRKNLPDGSTDEESKGKKKRKYLLKREWKRIMTFEDWILITPETFDEDDDEMNYFTAEIPPSSYPEKHCCKIYRSLYLR